MVRVELSILLVCVSVVVVGAYRPYCPCYAEPGYRCPPAPEGCELTKDECGCCDVCAGVRGEPCGTGLPSCAAGLTCVLEECNPQAVDVTLPDGTVTQQLSEPPCLFLPYFQRGTCEESGTAAAKRQALPSSGTSCEVSGVTIQEGEFVDVTPCQHCGCFNGQPICAVVDCFWSPSCAQWAYPDDQCCPVCVQDGHPWVSPVASKRETPARACVVDGVTIEEGEWQQTDEYGCTECGYTGGQPLCWSMACALDINCAEWERVPGQCCPVCTAYHQHHVDIPMVSKRTSPVRPTTCEVDGVTIAEGEFKPIDQNGCTTCGCSNGQSFCMAIGCALPANCAETEQIPDQCCPVCTSYATCEVNGVTIQEGESKPTDQYGCETCTCVNGQPLCQAIACALPANCAETERVPGQCCPVCTSFTTCEANGVTIPEGEWVPTDEYGCETCTCDNGMTLCQYIACAPLFNCAETERVPGQCCPVCKTIIQDLPLLLSKRQAIPIEGESCEVDGVTIPNGEFAHVTPCKPCTCFNGQSICTHVDCPWGWPPNCVQWEYPSDQCCPVCVQQDLELSSEIVPLPVASKRQADAGGL